MKKSLLLLLLPAALLVWWIVSRHVSDAVIHFSPVSRSTIESTVSTNGKVEPAEWAAARALGAGVVSTVDVQRGEEVTAGQALAHIDTRLAEAELAGAQARRQEAEVEAATINRGGKVAAVANLEDALRSAQSAVAVAQRNYDSLKRLLPLQAATKLQVDEARDSLDSAKLTEAAALNQRQAIVTASDKDAAAARVKDAQASVDLAAQRLRYGLITAPISGVLYQFDLKKGAYLQAGELAGYVGIVDRVKVLIYVDEPDLGRVKLNMPVSITWDAQPGKKWNGIVNRLPTEVVALGTRTVGEVSTIVDNPARELLPGVTVNVTVIANVVKDAMSVPKAAVSTIRGATGVYKLANGRIQWTPVKTGASDIANVQILSGLEATDRVADRVVEPSDAELKDGMRVKVDAE